MKRFIRAALAAAVLIPGAWALNARAEGGDHDGPPPHEAGMMGEKMAEKMKEKLGLTDDQAAKFKAAMKAHGDAVKPLHEKLRDGMKKLHGQVEAKASDADIKATLDSLKSTRKDMEAAQEKLHAEVSTILTPTQQAKMLLGMMHRMHERMGEGKGRWGRGEKGEKGERRGPPKEDHDDDDGE